MLLVYICLKLPSAVHVLMSFLQLFHRLTQFFVCTYMLFLWAYMFLWDCVYFSLIWNNFWMPCGNCAIVSLNTSGQHAGWVTDREGKSQAMERGGVSEREREKKKRDAGAKTQSNGTWVKNPVSVNWHPLRQSRNAGTVTLLRPGITSASRRFDWTGNKFQTCARQMMTNAACAEPVLQMIQQSGGQSRAEERRRRRRAFASEFICFTCNPILSNSKKRPKMTGCGLAIVPLSRNIFLLSWLERNPNGLAVAFTRWEQKGELTKTKKMGLRRTTTWDIYDAIQRQREGVVALSSLRLCRRLVLRCTLPSRTRSNNEEK